MDNEFNEVNENKGKSVDKNKMAKVLSAIAFLAILFCGTYFITDYINTSKENNAINDEEGRLVLNQGSQVLKDETIIVLKTKNVIDSEKNISALKEILKLTGDVTKDSLEKALEANGYKIGEIDDNKIVFNSLREQRLIPNKFYLGEKDGMLAIYETNELGTPTDIYTDKTPIDVLMEEQQAGLKTFKKYYDTEEEARIQLTSYSS